MIFSSPILIEYRVFKKIRFKKDFFVPNRAYIRCKQLMAEISLEKVTVYENTFITYSFSIENGELKEQLLLTGTETFIEFYTPIKKEKEFLDYILPLFGVVFYDFLPAKNQTSGEATRILSSILSKSETFIYKFGEILEKKDDTSGLWTYTGGDGFYCFYYSFLKNIRIENENQLEEFAELKEKWKNVIVEIKKYVKKNRVKLVLNQV